MTLSEKLYMLRKKNGLSQEQLAEQLNVSRQAISKWESGACCPERDKLIAVSNYFHVSLDYLMKEESTQSEDTSQTVEKETTQMTEREITQMTERETAQMTERKAAQMAERAKKSVGFIICIGGIICLIVWGLLSMINPAASDQISESSVITIDGNGIFLILCVVSIIVGTVLLLKGSGKK